MFRTFLFLSFFFVILSGSLAHGGVSEGKQLSPPSSVSIVQKSSLSWPLVYPEKYKIGAYAGISSLGSMAPTVGVSGEFLWMQVLFGGAGYELNFLPGKDSLPGAKLHRILLHTGVIIQLDSYEKHHLLILFRPGFSMLRSDAGNATRFGFGLGLGYDYSINSDYILSPEFLIQRFSTSGISAYGITGWSFGLRFSFGK